MADRDDLERYNSNCEVESYEYSLVAEHLEKDDCGYCQGGIDALSNYGHHESYSVDDRYYSGN